MLHGRSESRTAHLVHVRQSRAQGMNPYYKCRTFHSSCSFAARVFREKKSQRRLATLVSYSLVVPRTVEHFDETNALKGPQWLPEEGRAICMEICRRARG